jgi:hypothetical protein
LDRRRIPRVPTNLVLALFGVLAGDAPISYGTRARRLERSAPVPIDRPGARLRGRGVPADPAGSPPSSLAAERDYASPNISPVSRKGGEPMKGINLGRVIIGGLVAGVLINISEFVLNTVVLKTEMEAGMKALGKTVPQS